MRHLHFANEDETGNILYFLVEIPWKDKTSSELIPLTRVVCIQSLIYLIPWCPRAPLMSKIIARHIIIIMNIHTVAFFFFFLTLSSFKELLFIVVWASLPHHRDLDRSYLFKSCLQDARPAHLVLTSSRCVFSRKKCIGSSYSCTPNTL